MKLRYYADTDGLHVELKSGSGTETREVSCGLDVDLDAAGDIVDLDAAGDIVGFDICQASKRHDLFALQLGPSPLRSYSVA